MTTATATAATLKPGSRSMAVGLIVFSASLVLLLAFIGAAQAVEVLQNYLLLIPVLLLGVVVGLGLLVAGAARRLLARG